MKEVLIVQAEECRSNLNRLVRRLKYLGQVGGEGAAKASVELANASWRLRKVLGLKLAAPDNDDDGSDETK